MTSEQLTIILAVIDRIAPKYEFGFYTVDDIKQEAFLICTDAMEKYDPSLPLENFISRHLSNRLKTLIRNKYSRSSTGSENHAKLNEAKKNLVDLHPCEGSREPEIQDSSLEQLSNQESVEMVLEGLSSSMRNDFYRMANGVSIPHNRKVVLVERIKEILGEDW